jgi:hypothetical protein
MALLDRAQVKLVAINLRPEFSPALLPAVLDSLGRRFPEADTIDRFLVRWR